MCIGSEPCFLNAFLPGISRNLVDVILVMGASNKNNFEKQKQAVREVVQLDKNSNVIYGVIQYGNNTIVNKSLGEEMDKKALIKFLRSLLWKETGEALLDGVRQANVMFEKFGRPKARKILVVFSDDRLRDSSLVIEKTGDNLRVTGIKTIGVVVGNRGDKVKLLKLSGKNPLKIGDNDKPEKTGKHIAEEILKGKKNDISRIFD